MKGAGKPDGEIPDPGAGSGGPEVRPQASSGRKAGTGEVRELRPFPEHSCGVGTRQEGAVPGDRYLLRMCLPALCEEGYRVRAMARCTLSAVDDGECPVDDPLAGVPSLEGLALIQLAKLWQTSKGEPSSCGFHDLREGMLAGFEVGGRAAMALLVALPGAGAARCATPSASPPSPPPASPAWPSSSTGTVTTLRLLPES